MDPTFLLELVGGDRSVAQEVMRDFVAVDTEDRRALAAAVAAGDPAEVRRRAHRINGAARSIGADEYARCAAVLEQGAPGTDTASAIAVLERCASDIARWAASFA